MRKEIDYVYILIVVLTWEDDERMDESNEKTEWEEEYTKE